MAGESVFSVHTGRRCGRLDNNSTCEKIQTITKVTNLSTSYGLRIQHVLIQNSCFNTA